MICTSVRDPLEKAEGDLVEYRLDYLANLDLDLIRTAREKERRPVIFTLRKASQGGHFKGTEEERLVWLDKLASLAPDYMDLEAEIPPSTIQAFKKNYPAIKWILSTHDFKETPADLEGMYQRMSRLPADFYKIAVFAASTLDTLRLLVWLKESNRTNVIAIPMGEKGLPGRILAPFVGSPFTFAAADAAGVTAPGQLAYAEMKRYFTFPHPAFYGLIGDPVSRSMSHLTHNALMQEAALTAVYVKMVVTAEELPLFIPLSKRLGFKGLSVTMPLKEAIIPFVDEISPEAAEMGAVNTLLISRRGIQGYNTDGPGAVAALEKKGPLKGKKTVLLGAGGTAKAILAAAKQGGALITLVNRDKERGEELARRFQVPFCPLERVQTCLSGDYDILINTTSNASPIPPDGLRKGKIFMEATFYPEGSPLLNEADAKGCPVVRGEELFLQQAIGQFRIWFPESNVSFERLLGEQVKHAVQNKSISQISQNLVQEKRDSSKIA